MPRPLSQPASQPVSQPPMECQQQQQRAKVFGAYCTFHSAGFVPALGLLMLAGSFSLAATCAYANRLSTTTTTTRPNRPVVDLVGWIGCRSSLCLCLCLPLLVCICLSVCVSVRVCSFGVRVAAERNARQYGTTRVACVCDTRVPRDGKAAVVAPLPLLINPRRALVARPLASLLACGLPL